jgi:hypothetical protein
MKMHDVVFAGGLLIFTPTMQPAGAQTVLSGGEAQQVLRIESLTASPDRVSGVLVNASPHHIKDVQLLIQYHWLWTNERNPGQDSPGRAATVKLDRELMPGETVQFSYTPDPRLPQRGDGHFMTEVDVAAFSVVIPQQRFAQR